MKVAIPVALAVPVLAALFWVYSSPMPSPEVRAYATVNAVRFTERGAAAEGGAQGPQPGRTHGMPKANYNTIFSIGPAGELIIDEAVGQRLQVLLDSLPAQHSLTELERVEGIARAYLPEPQASEALRLLNTYLDYSRDEASLLAQPRSAEDLASARDMLDRVAALRRQHFGPAAAHALFGEQEARDREAIEGLRDRG